MLETTQSPSLSAVAALRDELHGQLHLPGEDGFDAARQAWNLAVDQRPAAVALPASVADVQAVMRFAHATGTTVVPQGPGHNAGSMGDLSGVLLLRTTLLDEVLVDEDRLLARVEAGVLMEDLVSAAAEHGLAPISGSTGDVAAVSFALNGGIGWLSRELGLASESVVAIDAVLADGTAVHVTADEHPDLLWALRGGGGHYAVVTAMELRLHEVPTVYAGMLLWPGERRTEVAHAWHALTQAAPESFTSSLRVLSFPPLPELPPFLAGRDVVVVDGASTDGADEAAALLAPLRALGPELDTFAAAPATVLPMVHMDPPQPTPAMSGHALLDHLTPQAIAAFLDGLQAPMMGVELRHLGGALTRRPEGAGALGTLDAPYGWFAFGIPAVAELVAPLTNALAQAEAALGPWVTDRVYGNFAEHPVGRDRLHDGETVARLRAIKASYDPRGVIRAGHAL